MNGGLFSNKKIKVPRFTKQIVDLILKEASESFDWSDISPTIFGAVFESTLNPTTRRKGGMHYTSVVNIKKIIEPLFLADLKSEFKSIKDEFNSNRRNKKDINQKLINYQNKLSSLNFLDPACGSGNFLTETYHQLRILENEVLRLLNRGQALIGFEEEAFDPIKVKINQFYGIEINDFACTVAKTALWIAESQMIKETEDIFNKNIEFLPLKSYTNIIESDALCFDWSQKIPVNKINYIMGNPPFVGHQNRTDAQTKAMDEIFNGWDSFGKLDYVASWYKKCLDIIKNGWTGDLNWSIGVRMRLDF